MNTKEAIEFCESRKRLCDIEKNGSYMPNPFAENNRAQFTKVIALLKCGEKYEMMWKELLVNEFTFELAAMMLPIEEKYFPKEVKTNEAKMD